MDRLFPFVRNNWLLFVALIVILALLFVNLARSRLTGFREVRPDEAVRLMNHEDAVLLDIRSGEEYTKGHVMNALNIPFANLQDRLVDLQPHQGRALIICCENGRQAAQAGAVLRKHGYGRVMGLSGGLASWRSAGLPLVRA